MTNTRKSYQRKVAQSRGQSFREYLARGRALAQRRRLGQKMGGSIEELQAIVAKSTVPVTKCPPSIHCGWTPRWMP